MPRRYSGTAASAVLMEASSQLHQALMASLSMGATTLDDSTSEAVTHTVESVVHLAAELKVDNYKRTYTKKEPLTMIGLWYECNDGVVHNLSEYDESGWHLMACGDKRQPRREVREATGQEFCTDCSVVAYLPGEGG